MGDGVKSSERKRPPAQKIERLILLKRQEFRERLFAPWINVAVKLPKHDDNQQSVAPIACVFSASLVIVRLRCFEDSHTIWLILRPKAVTVQTDTISPDCTGDACFVTLPVGPPSREDSIVPGGCTKLLRILRACTEVRTSALHCFGAAKLLGLCETLLDDD